MGNTINFVTLKLAIGRKELMRSQFLLDPECRIYEYCTFTVLVIVHTVVERCT